MRYQLGEALKALRLSRKLTTVQLAELSGLGRSHISHIEKGKYNIRLDTIEQLLTALDGEIIIRPKK